MRWPDEHAGRVRTVVILSVLTAAITRGVSLPATAAEPEIRGTWITTTSNDDWTSANIGTTMSSLKQVGLNTVYVQAWKNGYTNFTSGSLAAFTGVSSTNSSVTSPTLLSDARTAAAASGLVMGAWFEYGTMAQFTGNTGTSTSTFSPLAVKCRDATWTVGSTSGTGWLLRDPNGNYTTGSNGFVWMNPLVPEVRSLIKGIVIDAVNQFDLQIVQFDDHLAWPQAYGWDSYTAAVYKQETGRNLPANIADANFATWRRGKTETFFAEVSDAVKAVKPSVIVSLSPSVITTSSASYCADWSQWMTKTDEVLPQVYRSTIASFNTDWPTQITASGTNVGELGAGLRLLGTGSSTPWSDLQQQIDRTRADGALGHSIWFSNGISNSGTNAADNYNSQLTAYYDVAANGIASNPHFQSVRWSGTGGNGGSGTWSQLASQWKDRSTIWVSSGTGIFDGVGGTVTVSGSVMSEKGLDFRTTGYTVTGGTLGFRGVFRSDNLVTVASGGTTTFSSLLTGTTGLTKSGAGTLVIDGSATGLTGGIAINAGTLRLGSGGAAGSLAAAIPITVASGGTLAFNRSDTYGGSFASLISGSGGVRVESGLLTMTAAQAYSGSTSVLSGGTLAVNGSLSSGGLFVAAGAALMGTGTVLGTTTIQGSHMPGASPGVETFENLVYSGAAPSVTWELWNDVDMNQPVAYDQVVVTGNLTFTDPTQVVLAFSGTGSAVDWNDAFWNSDRQWLLFDVGGATSGFANLSIGLSNWQDSAGRYFATERPSASFSVVKPGASGDVYIAYVAAPEPSAIALAGAGLVGLLINGLRRSRWGYTGSLPMPGGPN